MNEIWPLVTSNVTGFNVEDAKSIPAGQTGSLSYYRGIVDRFFYTVMYAIMVYMLGMASFKLIDMLPASVMRWLGKEGGAFSDQNSNGPEGLMTKMSVGTTMMTDQLGGLGKAGLSVARSQDDKLARRDW